MLSLSTFPINQSLIDFVCLFLWSFVAQISAFPCRLVRDISYQRSVGGKLCLFPVQLIYLLAKSVMSLGKVETSPLSQYHRYSQRWIRCPRISDTILNIESLKLGDFCAQLEHMPQQGRESWSYRGSVFALQFTTLDFFFPFIVSSLFFCFLSVLSAGKTPEEVVKKYLQKVKSSPEEV